jgi:hypothetical protein
MPVRSRSRGASATVSQSIRHIRPSSARMTFALWGSPWVTTHGSGEAVTSRTSSS